MKKILYSLFAILLICGGYLFYNRITDGFSIGEMASQTPYDNGYSQGRSDVETLINQPFHYIGKGCQFYVFESADGKYVIKFLKQKHLRLPFFWSHLPMPTFAREQLDLKKMQRRERAHKLMTSCHLALLEMPEETGLLYVHFDRSPIHVTLTLIDKIGLKHRIDPSAFEFIVQKKACTIEDTLVSLIEHNQVGELKTKVDQLVKLVYTRCKKGIRDKDRSFAQNVGFSIEGDHAVFTDVGQFFKDESIVSEEETQKDIAHRLGNLRFWCEERHPELIPYLPVN